MAKFCTSCGSEVHEGDNVCSNCGTPIKKDTDTPVQQGNTTVVVNQVQPKKSNGMATAGFVLSLISLLCCSPLSIVGLILSIVGMTKAKDCDGNGKGLAIAGIIISAIAIVFCIIALLIYGAAIVESAGSSY